jgi:hypothetical protein
MQSTPPDDRTPGTTDSATPAGQPSRRRRRIATASANDEPPPVTPSADNGQPDSAAQAPVPPTPLAPQPASTPPADTRPPRKADADADAIRGLRKVGGFHIQSKVKKRQLVIPARKPEPTWFVRVHPDPDYTREAYVIELKDKRQTYLILNDDLVNELLGEVAFKMKRLAVAITKQGTLFVWESATEWEGDKGGLWTSSILEAMDQAREEWVRVVAGEVAYETIPPKGTLPDPVWPDRTFEDIVGVAYKGRIIPGIDHKVLRELRGEE